MPFSLTSHNWLAVDLVLLRGACWKSRPHEKGCDVMSTQSPRTEDQRSAVVDAENVNEFTQADRWGISPVPWLWRTRVRILVVIDGVRITQSRDPNEFGLGFVLDTLRDSSFAWWVRFDVDVEHRQAPEKPFRFTNGGFNLDQFDQVWFFGDNPGEEAANDPDEGDGTVDAAVYAPLDNAELRVLATWMEHGGGVFATGDHSILGASMCSRIPRVRTMRMWTHAQGVPSYSDVDRHETWQHTLAGAAYDWEGDRWPQPIHPVYRQNGSEWFAHGIFPHPLLCGENGIIDRFPDHMHEGAVIEDENVELDKALGIPGFSGVEYPTIPQDILPTLAFGPAYLGNRPRPQVIARGMTTNIDAPPRLFGLIGVYDGDSARIGRVVVDSTWHHWFSLNLVGLREESPVHYRAMQNYYRNVALWLSTPAQRASMLFAATWGVLVGTYPGAFSRFMNPWEIGQRVIDVIGRTAPQCLISELVAALVMTGGPGRSVGSQRNGRPTALGPAVAVVNGAIVGGISLELVELARHYRSERALGRSTEVDVNDIRLRAWAGVNAGRKALVEALTDGGVELRAVCEALTAQAERGA
jgi:hypothetical protein